MELFIQNKDNPFAEPVQVFSNIENGFGIFGGKTHDYYSFYSSLR